MAKQTGLFKFTGKLDNVTWGKPFDGLELDACVPGEGRCY